MVSGRLVALYCRSPVRVACGAYVSLSVVLERRADPRRGRGEPLVFSGLSAHNMWTKEPILFNLLIVVVVFGT